MRSPGFLGTGAPLSADITLAIEFAIGLALVVGMALARGQRYRAHAWCQSTVVLLNPIAIRPISLQLGLHRTFFIIGGIVALSALQIVLPRRKKATAIA